MNTYVLGEITTLLVVSVLAGILIGWCIKSLLAGRSERKVRQYVARDVDEAMADVESLRATLDRKDEALAVANEELQKMRGRDISMKAGNTNQVEEINKLKNELAIARQSLDRNRSEFNAYRNESQKEVQGLTSQIARFTAGGPVYDERMSEAGETITALRNATRENDRVIDSLRARIKEGDSTVENLRSQLKSRDISAEEIERARNTADESLAKLNAALNETTAERDQLKRDYDITLTNKNGEISKLQNRLEELGKSQTELKQNEHALDKIRKEAQQNADRSQKQIAELKQTITHKEAERAAYLKDQKRMQTEIADLQSALRQQGQTEEELQTLKARESKVREDLQTLKLQHTKTQEDLHSANSLKTQVENKTAEVVALNDILRNVSDKRNELQAQVKSLESKLQSTEKQRSEQQGSLRKIADLTTELQQRDATIAKLRSDFDEVAHSRNQLGAELGELQAQTEQSQAAMKVASEKQLAQLASTLKDRDQSFSKLRKDMDDMTVSRDRLTAELQKLQARGTELESFKTEMQSAVAKRDSELTQRTRAYQTLQAEFANLSKQRDDYETRIEKLKAEVQQQAQQLKDQEQRSRLEIDALKPQISDLRAKLSMADSENQKISSELSDAAELRLALTEKESVIQNLQVEIQDAKLTGTAADPKAQSKIDNLTVALRDRDEEIARLNSAITDNRLASKKSQSEASLLKQEVESQSQLIKGLEEQAENTLTLHKKIAAQSTEIEELRASLYQGDASDASADTPDSSHSSKELETLRNQLQQKNSAYDSLTRQMAELKKQYSQQAASKGNNDALQNQITQLQGKLDAQNKDVQRLSSEAQQYAALKVQHEKLKSSLKAQPAPASASSEPASNIGQKNTAVNGNSSAKPRVFVRPENTTTTEALTGVSKAPTSEKVIYTRDGYRIKHLDGRDNLSLLPGISGKAESELNKHGVTEFEQISLWGKREVLHFAERSGIASSQAEGYNWPKLAREILQGTYRGAEYLESDSQ